jgi:hypothetical protein
MRDKGEGERGKERKEKGEGERGRGKGKDEEKGSTTQQASITLVYGVGHPISGVGIGGLYPFVI